MPDPILIAKAFAVAFVLGLAVTLLFGRSSRIPVTSAGAVLAVIIAVYAGLWLLELLPHFPPREALDRFLLVLLPAAAVAETIAAVSSRRGWAARGSVAALAAPVLLYGSVYATDLSGPGSRTWSPAMMWFVFTALAALLMAAWVALHRLAIRTQGLAALGCVAGATLGASLVIMLSGYATGGQSGVPLAAGLGGVALALLFRKAKPISDGAIGVGVVGLFALLVVGRLFAGLTDVNAALLFAAPLLGWLPEMLPARQRIRAALRLALAATPVVIALDFARQKFAADSVQQGAAIEGSLDDYMNFGK
jgi:hypothetical protein